MATKSRLARWIKPRFGLRWLFVGMLFLISAAGWWKFHRSLYVEEVAAIEGLLQSGAKAAIDRVDFRYFMGDRGAPDVRVPWNAPWADPLIKLDVTGNPGAEARNAALTLPRLKSYDESVQPYRDYRRRERSDDNSTVEALLGRPLPALPEPQLSLEALDAPLPDGTEVDVADAERIAAEIRAAWRNSHAHAPSRLIVSDTATLGGTPSIGDDEPIRVDVFDAGRGFRYDRDRYISETAWLALDDATYAYARLKEGWKRYYRLLDRVDERAEQWVYRDYADDDYPYAAADFTDYSVGERIRNSDEPYRFARIARIDDVRYRVDFAPFEIPDLILPDGSRMVLNVGSVAKWQCVLRSDLDWVPETARIMECCPGGPTIAYEERSLVQRFRRRGEFVTIEERLTRNTESQGGVPGVVGNRGTLRTLYVTELDPQFDERVFDPLTLDPEPWPDRRELPWLRWYRMTFLLACGLTFLSIGQRFWPRRATPTEDAGDPQDGS